MRAIPVAPVGGVGLLATDNCDPVVTYTDDKMITPGIVIADVITRTWTTEDVCGNAHHPFERSRSRILLRQPLRTSQLPDPGPDASCTYDADPSITGDMTDEDDNCDPSLDATIQMTHSQVPVSVRPSLPGHGISRMIVRNSLGRPRPLQYWMRLIPS